jgi:hypothetical protein
LSLSWNYYWAKLNSPIILKIAIYAPYVCSQAPQTDKNAPGQIIRYIDNDQNIVSLTHWWRLMIRAAKRASSSICTHFRHADNENRFRCLKHEHAHFRYRRFYQVCVAQGPMKKSNLCATHRRFMCVLIIFQLCFMIMADVMFVRRWCLLCCLN